MQNDTIKSVVPTTRSLADRVLRRRRGARSVCTLKHRIKHNVQMFKIPLSKYRFRYTTFGVSYTVTFHKTVTAESFYNRIQNINIRT